jgi:hypothetical protein
MKPEVFKAGSDTMKFCIKATNISQEVAVSVFMVEVKVEAA